MLPPRIVEHVVHNSVKGYKFTVMAPVKAVERKILSQCEASPGFQTAASLFGAEFAESVVGIELSAVAVLR